MLRHPVVITSLEEDFKKIGLLKEDTEPAPEESTAVSADDIEDEEVEEDTDDDSADDDLENAEEALERMEAFARQWDEDEGVEEFLLTQEEMEALESMGTTETISEEDDGEDSFLDEGDDDDDEESFLASFDSDFFEDLELDEDDLAEKYGDDFEARQAEMIEMMQALEGRRRAAGGRGMVKTKRMSAKAKAKARRYYKAHKRKISRQRHKRAKSSRGKRLQRLAKSMESVTDISTALEHIDSLVADLHEEVDAETAMPAFANIALVAEMLAQVFEATLDEDVDTSDNVEAFTKLAEAAAEAVEFLHENEDDLDEEAMSEAYSDYLDALREGIATYQELSGAVLEDESDDTEGNEEDAA